MLRIIRKRMQTFTYVHQIGCTRILGTMIWSMYVCVVHSKSPNQKAVPKWIKTDPKSRGRRWDGHKEAKAKLGQGHTIPTWARTDGCASIYLGEEGGWIPSPATRSSQATNQESVDELWLGVKCHSNPELARSPRNALRRSSWLDHLGVKHC